MTLEPKAAPPHRANRDATAPPAVGGNGRSTGCPPPSGAVPGAQPVAPPPHSPFWCNSRTSFAIPPAQPGPGSAAERSSPPGLRDRGRAGQAGEPRRTTSGRCQPSLLGSRPRRPLLPCPPPAPLIAPAGRSLQPIQPPGAGVAPPRPSRAPQSIKAVINEQSPRAPSAPARYVERGGTGRLLGERRGKNRSTTVTPPPRGQVPPESTAGAPQHGAAAESGAGLPGTPAGGPAAAHPPYPGSSRPPPPPRRWESGRAATSRSSSAPQEEKAKAKHPSNPPKHSKRGMEG